MFEFPPSSDVWTLLLVNGFVGTVLSELLWLWCVHCNQWCMILYNSVVMTYSYYGKMDKLLRDHLLVIYKHLLTSKSSRTIIPEYRNYDFKDGGIVVLERK